MSRVKMPGQEPFDGMEPSRNLASRNAFARAATPEYWNLDAADCSDISERMIAAAAPDRFRPNLIHVRRGAPLSAAYEDENGSHIYVPLLPEEYTLLPRTMSPRRYGEVSVARALAGKSSPYLSEATLRARADTHSIEAIQSKLERITTYTQNTLTRESSLLARLQEAASHPGFWRMKEAEMRMNMEYVLSFLVPNALRVVGNAREWTDIQADQASRAVQYRLFFDRAGNKHIANWQTMLGLLQDYQQEKIKLFGDRQGRLAGYLHQHRVK